MSPARTRTRIRRASEEHLSSPGWSDLKISLRQPLRPARVSTRIEPEFGRVVGEGFQMPRDQFVVAGRCPIAVLICLFKTGGLAVPRIFHKYI